MPDINKRKENLQRQIQAENETLRALRSSMTVTLQSLEQAQLEKYESGFIKGCDDWQSSELAALLKSSSGWKLPVNGVISAGTWSYPDGGLHLGMDLAAGMHSKVYAPANAIVLYANAPCEDNEGYLGNLEGWPLGGGNTIALLCAVKGRLYGVTFCHLSSTLYVQAGMSVLQGDIIALSGNSGNSTGPHTHIEVFELYADAQEILDTFKEYPDFQFGTGWDTPGACSVQACKVRPETIFFSSEDLEEMEE